jgi:rod shape-determining protein MreD
MRIILKYLLWFVGLVAMQTFVFDNLVLPGGFIIAFYTLFIFILPFNTPNNVLMIIGFALGLSIDAFADTYGLNASAALTLAAIRLQ